MHESGRHRSKENRRVYDGGYEAKRSIFFMAARTELFALLGTNGAGKTSTVELLGGLARPAGGSIRVLGRSPFTERAAVCPRIGVMLQEGGFLSDLTVAETVRMWAGATSGARPTGQALDLVGLSHRAKVRVKALSGGEKRRLDLALLGNPEVLFSDEPTTGLDAEGLHDTGESVRTVGGVVRLQTGKPQRTTTRLLAWAEEARLELRRLDVRPASLEEEPRCDSAQERVGRPDGAARPTGGGRPDGGGSAARAARAERGARGHDKSPAGTVTPSGARSR
ncbi:ATP-binding cassette domain-containing protein [Streptomyces sp. NPDC101181]|uniref:ATP-binding cassette domain-containing protein n=1 Tax=Streptomyces sp. NPDC101181 TaxID=3366125 RepID=UPI0037FBDDAC